MMSRALTAERLHGIVSTHKPSDKRTILIVVDKDGCDLRSDVDPSMLIETLRAALRPLEARDTVLRKAREHANLKQLGPSLYDADPDCDHTIEAQWSGVRCTKCGGWRC